MASLLDRVADGPSLRALGASRLDACPMDDSDGTAHRAAVLRNWTVIGSTRSALAALAAQLERLGWKALTATEQGMTGEAPLTGADVAPTVVTQALTRVDVTATTVTVEVDLPGEC